MINNIPNLIKEYEGVSKRQVLQKEIADAIRLPEGTFSRYVNGNINGSKFDIEFRLCRFFTQGLGRVIRRDDLYTFDQAELEREPA